MTSASGEASGSSGDRCNNGSTLLQHLPTPLVSDHTGQTATVKRKRNLPGTPDPDAEVIALSPKTLMATNRFLCEICNKGFQRDQNLQLHRRGHNLPWKLKQRPNMEIRKRVYICPEPSCVHHDPSRALGDLTGIKKHFCRKHGEKKWKCDKCSKRYAVQSDWKAHSKTCGTREYRCDCGTLFSRRDSFITHRAFCDALAEENARASCAAHLGDDSYNNALGMQAGLPFNIMGAPTSPGNVNLVGSSGPSMDTLSHSVRAGLTGNASSPGPLTQDGMSLMQPWWDHETTTSGSGTASAHTRLSLWLGNSTGSAPGQPGSQQLLRNSREFQAGVSASLNQMDTYISQEGTAMAGIGQTGSIADMGALSGLSLSEFEALSNWPERRECLPHAVSGGAKGPAALPSVSSLYSQANSSCAQMSATALLQKAAQMGATASNISIFKGYGMAGSESSSGAPMRSSAWSGGQAQDSGRGGMPSMISSLVQSHPFMKGRPGALQIMGSPNDLRGDVRIMENTSLQELLNSTLPGEPNLLDGPENMPSVGERSYGDPRSMNAIHLRGNGPINQGRSSRESMGQASQQSSNGIPEPRFINGRMGAFGSLSKGEDAAADSQTRDFLGVQRGASMLVGSAGGMGRSISQRDFVNTASDEYGNSRENLRE